MDNDISLALTHWREMNDNPRMWGRLEIIQFESSRAVRLYYGIRTNDRIDRHHAITHYHLHVDGNVTVYNSFGL